MPRRIPMDTKTTFRYLNERSKIVHNNKKCCGAYKKITVREAAEYCKCKARACNKKT